MFTKTILSLTKFYKLIIFFINKFFVIFLCFQDLNNNKVLDYKKEKT